jgi:S1-C subfamily serine protease
MFATRSIVPIVILFFCWLTSATRQEVPDHRAMAQPERPVGHASVRAYLGTIPDYSQGDANGLRVAGVIIGGPAAQAEVQGGNVIVDLAGKTIENIYDYTYVLNAMKIGVPTALVVQRGVERLTLMVTPGSRE